MIDEGRTLEIYGYTSDELSHGSKKSVVAVCEGCGKYRVVRHDAYRDLCRSCCRKGKVGSFARATESELEHWRQLRYAAGAKSMSENRSCASFLGVYVAERVLHRVFKNVKTMPYGNPGFDFICSKGKKVDVKAACVQHHAKHADMWQFHVRHNMVPDYFLCMAFDNRVDLTPLHLWLLPAGKFNHLSGISIAVTTIHKWDRYAIPVDKVVACCNSLR